MNFRQVTICAAAALLAAAAGCRAHAPACNLPFEMPQVARPAIPSNAVSVADCGGSGLFLFQLDPHSKFSHAFVSGAATTACLCGSAAFGRELLAE